MGSLYWHRDRVLVAVGASGVAVCRMRRGGREDVREPGSQDSLAVPILSGPWALHANNLWQCQSRVAKKHRKPKNTGSARAGWRTGDSCQFFLAVPELGGFCQINLAVPGLGGIRVFPASNPWQCQDWVAPYLTIRAFCRTCRRQLPCPVLSTTQIAQDLFSPAGIEQPRTKLPLGNMMLCCGNPISNVLHQIELPNEFLERSSVHHLPTRQRKACHSKRLDDIAPPRIAEQLLRCGMHCIAVVLDLEIASRPVEIVTERVYARGLSIAIGDTHGKAELRERKCSPAMPTRQAHEHRYFHFHRRFCVGDHLSKTSLCQRYSRQIWVIGDKRRDTLRGCKRHLTLRNAEFSIFA